MAERSTSHFDVLFISVAVDVRASRRQYVNDRHFRHAFVAVKLLLYDEGGYAFVVAQYAFASGVDFKSETKIAHLARRTDIHGACRVIVGLHFAQGRHFLNFRRVKHIFHEPGSLWVCNNLLFVVKQCHCLDEGHKLLDAFSCHAVGEHERLARTHQF